MADTLSRKHRLMQQQQVEQQFARNQQSAVPYGTSTNDHNEFRVGLCDERTTLTTKNAKTRMSAVEYDNADDNDNDGFNVFKVVEVGTNTCQQDRRVRDKFCSTREQQQQDRRLLQSNHQARPAIPSSGRSRRENFKGDVNSVRNNSSGQIERRNENDFELSGGDADYDRHWREQHSIYDDDDDDDDGVGSLSRKTYNNHLEPEQQRFPIHATNSNHRQSKSLSTLNGTSTTKSIGGNSSSGFSSSNGSYSSSSQQVHQQQQHHNHHQQQRHYQRPIHKDDCVAQVSNNNKKQQHRNFRGHEGAAMGKRSKLIDDLDRLLMAPGVETSGSIDSRPISNDEERRRRSSLVSPTESHISTATTSSQHPSIRATLSHKMAPNFVANNDTANDFDYSTLCRDEFSSFIQIEPALPSSSSSKQGTSVAAESDSACGPMLVGVHETESSNVRPALLHRDDMGVDDHGDMMSDDDDDGPESDEVGPYDDFRPSRDDDDCDNIYEELPGTRSIPSSIDEQLSSPPIISTSPSCTSAENNPFCSPIVCQNYSPDMMTGDDEDSDSVAEYNKSYAEYDDDDDDDDDKVQSKAMMPMITVDRCDELSKMLDIYVEKVKSLVRLSKNDKSISIEEAFKFDHYREGYCFEVRAEHRTPVAFVHAHSGGRENFMRIIQEVEYEAEPESMDTAAIGQQRIEVCDSGNTRRRTIVTHVKEHDDASSSSLAEQNQDLIYRYHRPLISILDSIQLSPELSWSRRKEHTCDNSANDLVSRQKRTATDIRSLEKSLIARLGSSPDNDADHNHDQDRRKIPMAIIREHMREFIENYNTYQMELSQETSFGDGSWHENWLFASKRPRSSSDQQQSHQSEAAKFSSAKRARFGSTGADTRPTNKWRQKDQGEMNDDDDDDDDEKEADREGRSACEKADLIKYSTLILARCKPVKLTLVANDNKQGHHPYETSEQTLRGYSDSSGHVESFYEAQLERVSELELVAIESSRQTDVCRLLLRDTDDEGDDDDDECGTMDSNNNNNNKRKKKQTRPAQSNKSLLVSYDSTSQRPALHHANKFYFTASGYLFQTNLIKLPIGSSKLRAKLERKILNKLISSIGEQSPSSFNQQREPATVNATNRLQLAHPHTAGERARFAISLSNIELINRLPVIQFCAKISGSLPIRVRWFRQLPASGSEHQQHNQQQQHRYEELSDISAAKRRNLNIRSVADGRSHWPIELQASYDYEYETAAASWFRFKRNKDDILFEIREPSLDTDYNRVYKCLIENASSRKECKFQLTTKRVVNWSPSNCDRLSGQPPRAKSRKAAATAIPGDGNDGHALLRTWSQRTLNKPQPSEPKVPTDAEQHQRQINSDAIVAAEAGAKQPAVGGRQQTVGRLSASSVDEDKFGENFPYHPENLLKRLEENKFSIPAKRKLAASGPSATMNDCRLTSTSDLLLPLESAAAAEPTWSNSKILIIDDEVVESHYPKQLQPTVGEQLALANSSLNSAHADPMQSNSHIGPVLVNNKENFGSDSTVAGYIEDEKVQPALLRERPRAVINPRPTLGEVHLVDGSAGGLRATQQVTDSRESQTPPERLDNDELEMKRKKVPIQQPRPRLRLSQTVNSSSSCIVNNDAREQDRKENSRSNEHVQSSIVCQANNQAAVSLEHSDASRALPSNRLIVNSSTGFDASRDVDRRQSAAASAKSTADDDVSARKGDDGTRSIVSKHLTNHQKTGPNVRSLISRFSLA